MQGCFLSKTYTKVPILLGKVIVVKFIYDFIIQLRGYSPGQGIWSGMYRLGKAGQGKRGLVSLFPCFLGAIAEV